VSKERQKELHDNKGDGHGVHHDGVALDPVGGPQLLLNFASGGFGGISSLDVLVNSNQRLLQSLEGACVQHFLLDLSRVRTPGHQEQLLLLGALSCALALVLIFKVVQSVSTLAISTTLQVVQEVVIRGVTVTLGFNSDRFLLFDIENTVTVSFVLLDILKDALAIVSYSYTRRHCEILGSSVCSNGIINR